jgi:membrane protein
MLRAAVLSWFAHSPTEMAAAISYFAIFSMAPLLLLAIAAAGAVVGQDRVRGEIVQRAGTMLGEGAAGFVDTVIRNASRPAASQVASIIGFVTLLIGASGAFLQLKAALNRVWEVKPRPGLGILRMLRSRLVSFLLVLLIAALLLGMVVLNTYLATVISWISEAMPGWMPVAQTANIIVTLAVVSVLFGMVFKYLPDAHIDWREVRIGAAVTGLLFTAGQAGFSIYLARASPASVYGAAGSAIILLLWIYFTALVILLGAEITRAHAMDLGKPVTPKDTAEASPDSSRQEVRRAAGMPEPAPRPPTGREAQGSSPRSSDLPPLHEPAPVDADRPGEPRERG